jgi:uracil-DNA glycosylase
MLEVSADFAWHLERLRACRRCPAVAGRPLAQPVTQGRIYLRGQAPGPTEEREGMGFCGPAGRTLFRWFASIGAAEPVVRERVFMGALIRCFPGRNADSGKGRGGDRRPSRAEIEACSDHFATELRLLRPELVLLVGQMAIAQLLPGRTLEDVVGRAFTLEHAGHRFTALPLPHPSGLSRWIQKEPGQGLLRRALRLLGEQPAWRETFAR